MKLIRNDPIIHCMERSGYPPWLSRGGGDFTERETDTSCGEDKDGKY